MALSPFAPRVVSLVPSATETLLALGVVPLACTRFCEQPQLRHVGGTKDPDIDAIADLAHMPARAVVSLHAGDMFALRGWNATRLTIAGRTIGTGPAGIRNERYALSLGASA